MLRLRRQFKPLFRIEKPSGKTLIAFDYAIKFLLRDKSWYEIVEDCISSLLESAGYGPVKITKRWIGPSKKDLLSLPEDVKHEIGYALYQAQLSKQPENTKILKGFHGADVIEILVDDRAGTYRSVYTIRFSKAIFVLHVFQKKSKSGIATPKKDIDLIKSRLKLAEAAFNEKYLKRG